MDNNHKLTLYLTCYLARFDEIALQNLGNKNWEYSFLDISNKLDVKKYSVTNGRDKFNLLFGYRAGWYQRPMSPSRTNIALAFKNLDEPEIGVILKGILSGRSLNNPEKLSPLLSIEDENSDKVKRAKFIFRGLHSIEVKVLASNALSILFTNKEWVKTRQERGKNTVCFFSNINESPEISFINDPSSKLDLRKNIMQTIQTQCSVSSKELQKIEN